LDELYDKLLHGRLDEETRELLPQIHPTFTDKREQVAIVTIELSSVHGDTPILWAKWSGGRIRYQIADPFDEVEDFFYELPQQTSLRPFSLHDLIVFLDAVRLHGADPKWHRFGFPLLYNEMNFEADPNLESLREFTTVSSDFYPDLEAHYGKVIGDWYSVRKREAHEGCDNLSGER